MTRAKSVCATRSERAAREWERFCASGLAARRGKSMLPPTLPRRAGKAHRSEVKMTPHRNAALDQTGDIVAALGWAQARAVEAENDGRVIYTGRLGFAQKNLLMLWYYYAGLTRLRPRPTQDIAGVRKEMRLRIGEYRKFLDQERTGIYGRLDGEAA